MSYDYSGYYSAPPATSAEGAAHGYGASAYGAPPPSYPSSYPPPYGAPPAYGAPPYGAPASADEVRTIFITGFPADVKERELNNLLRFLPGYDASQMNWKNGQAQGFALFTTGAYARAACDAITQLVFDDGAVLRCEMARKNMYIKDDPMAKRQRTAPGAFPGTYPPAAPYSRPPGGYSGGPSGGPSSSDNPPCNTLFVGNLCETVNEAELNSIFAVQPGFRQLKIVRGRNTTAFVEYDTLDNAQKVHTSQQGALLASNAERGGIRIQYSRNPFGKKRDYTGVMIDTPVRQPDYVAPGAGVSLPGPPMGADHSHPVPQHMPQHTQHAAPVGYEPVPYNPDAAAEGVPAGEHAS